MKTKVMTNSNLYAPRPWQLPHLLATPVGGTVLIVQRCNYQQLFAKSVVHDELKDLWTLISQEIEVDGRINFELAECQDDRFNVTPWFACPLGPVGTVLAVKGVGDFRTTAIDLRRTDTINSERHDEVLRAGYPFGYDMKTLDENPCNTFKRRYLADNPGATWGDWAWFIIAERVERA